MAAYDLPNINSASPHPSFPVLCFSTHSLSFILPFCLGSYANAIKTVVTVSNGIHPSLSIKGTGHCLIEKKQPFGMCLRSLIWSLVKFWLKPRRNGCSPLGSSACLASWRRAAANPEFADWATAFPLVSGLRGLTVAVLRVAVEIIPKDGDLVDSWFIPGEERW